MLVPEALVELIYNGWAAESRTIFACVPDFGLGHIQEAFETVMETIEPALSEDEPFDAIGHSMGGFLAMMLAMRFPRQCVHGISVGTPWGGTLAAHPNLGYPWPFAGARCMRPGSRYLKEQRLRIALIADDALGPQIHTIRTPCDGLMLPSRAAELRLEGVVNHLVEGGLRLNHFTQPSSGKVARLINAICADEPVVQLARPQFDSKSILQYRPRIPGRSRQEVPQVA
jgi:pimeloyl-ACP methyl ester carboxylesterase